MTPPAGASGSSEAATTDATTCRLVGSAGDEGVRTVDQLAREHFGAWIDVPSRGVGGYLYVIRDEYHDGYPSRHLVLVDEDGGAAEEEFTDSNPVGYPKTMHTRCLIRDDRPAVGAGQQELPIVEAPVAAGDEGLRDRWARKLFHEFVTGEQAAWDKDDWWHAHHRAETYRVADELLAEVSAYAERRAREFAAAELRDAVDVVENTLDAYIALGCSDTLARVLCELAEALRVRARVCEPIAAALLAGPLRQLVTERAEAVAAVERVREVADVYVESEADSQGSFAEDYRRQGMEIDSERCQHAERILRVIGDKLTAALDGS